MSSQEVNAAIRESLGLPPKPEPQPTVPQEGHICDFPIWSYSKEALDNHQTYNYLYFSFR
jgi:hypothetical protein